MVAGIEDSVRDILVALGEDPDREGLVKTPERVARSYEFLASGYQ
ncbi:MAG: GTP cyclohydrolase I, partial [bacterium]